MLQSHILRLQDVVKITGLSSSWIYKKMKDGEFPPNFKIFKGGRATGWLSSDIENFIEKIKDKNGVSNNGNHPVKAVYP